MPMVEGAVSATASVTGTAAASASAVPPANFEPKILAFACHWCTYSGADLAGLNRMNYPANVRVLRVPCSGRVNPQHVLAALNRGVDGVLVCGCHPGDCHYVSGNYFAKRRLMAFKRLLEYTGLEPERFQVRWISGSEAGKFRDTVISVCEQVRRLGPYVSDPTVEQGDGGCQGDATCQGDVKLDTLDISNMRQDTSTCQVLRPPDTSNRTFPAASKHPCQLPKAVMRNDGP